MGHWWRWSSPRSGRKGLPLGGVELVAWLVISVVVVVVVVVGRTLETVVVRPGLI